MNSEERRAQPNPIGRAIAQAVFLVLFYCLLIFLLPASRDAAQHYNLTLFQYKLVRLAVSIPALTVWLAAFMGYATLHQYAQTIRKTPEGAHFDRLATGAGWLAWSLPISSLVVLLLNAIASSWPGFHATAIITGNYVNMLFLLIAFSIIGSATRGLANDAKLKLSLSSARAIILLFLVTGVTYCLLTFRQVNPTSLNSLDNPYFLPIWLVVLSIIIPYLYAWFVGLLAAYEITLFSKQISGVLYRQALRLLAGGLIAVIVSSIAIQYLNGVLPSTGHLILNYKILLVWLFRVIGGSGFVLLAIGALRLKKIEDV